MKKIFIVIVTIVNASLMAESDTALNRALNKIINETIYSYESTKTVYKDSEKVVKDIIYNPLDNQSFTLIGINGGKPTSKETKSFLKDTKDEKGGNSIIYGFIGDKYRKTYDDGTIVKYEYTTRESFMPDKDFKLLGEITLNREEEEIQKITLSNPVSFSVMGAKLTMVHMVFLFDKIDEEHMAVSSIEFKLKGKAMMKEFSQSSITNNYNFKVIK